MDRSIAHAAVSGPVMSEKQDPHVPASIAQLPPTMVRATLRWDSVSLKWRDLSERRKAHFVELYQSGRWRHYYTEEEFRAELHKAVAIARRWGAIVQDAEMRRADAEAAQAAAEAATAAA